MHDTKSIAHRDLKLDNILIDDDLNLILADFGYATSANRPLNSYRGTKTYMAPEVKLLMNDPGVIYDGKAIDIFSAGVILFVIVVGIFPFIEARPEEPNYKMIYDNNYQEYWTNFDPDNVLSTDFK